MTDRIKKGFIVIIVSMPFTAAAYIMTSWLSALNCVVLVRYLTGMVEKRTLEKYEREAKEKNRETW